VEILKKILFIVIVSCLIGAKSYGNNYTFDDLRKDEIIIIKSIDHVFEVDNKIRKLLIVPNTMDNYNAELNMSSEELSFLIQESLKHYKNIQYIGINFGYNKERIQFNTDYLIPLSEFEHLENLTLNHSNLDSAACISINNIINLKVLLIKNSLLEGRLSGLTKLEVLNFASSFGIKNVDFESLKHLKEVYISGDLPNGNCLKFEFDLKPLISCYKFSNFPDLGQTYLNNAVLNQICRLKNLKVLYIATSCYYKIDFNLINFPKTLEFLGIVSSEMDTFKLNQELPNLQMLVVSDGGIYDNKKLHTDINLNKLSKLNTIYIDDYDGSALKEFLENAKKNIPKILVNYSIEKSLNDTLVNKIDTILFLGNRISTELLEQINPDSTKLLFDYSDCLTCYYRENTEYSGVFSITHRLLDYVYMNSSVPSSHNVILFGLHCFEETEKNIISFYNKNLTGLYVYPGGKDGGSACSINKRLVDSNWKASYGNTDSIIIHYLGTTSYLSEVFLAMSGKKEMFNELKTVNESKFLSNAIFYIYEDGEKNQSFFNDTFPVFKNVEFYQFWYLGDSTFIDFEKLNYYNKIQELEVSADVINFESISKLPSIKIIQFDSKESLKFEVENEMKNLEYIRLGSKKNASVVLDLKKTPSLKKLTIYGDTLLINAKGKHANLEELYISGASEKETIKFLKAINKINNIHINSNSKKIYSILERKKIETLIMDSSFVKENIGYINKIKSLKYLDLRFSDDYIKQNLRSDIIII
jgi:hypothetical protein